MRETLLIIYCVLILMASLAGGWIPMWIRLTHRRMQIAVSLVAGVMLGVGMLHLLPHALLQAPEAADGIFGCVLLGFLVMFFIERFFCFHHHEAPTACDRDHQHGHELSWGGAAVGLSLHTVIAGIALAADVEAGSDVFQLAGLGAFLVIFLHKPFDSLTLSTLMAVGGWSTFARHLVNAIFALMVPLGVVFFHFGWQLGNEGSPLLAYALAFSAGTFLCIAMSDLLPELQFHSHDRIVLSAALLLGLGLAWGIGLVGEGGHSHSHQHEPPPAKVEHDHAEHDH